LEEAIFNGDLWARLQM